MRLRSFAASLLAVAFAATVHGQASLTGGTYTQDFDSLANTGTSSTLPAGWLNAESGTNANGAYATGTGSSNTGDTYSFGAAGSSERAFGGLRSGSLVPSFGACFTNNTGAALTTLDVAYTGEQWRNGNATARADRLDFQYSTDATSLTTGSWTDVDDLDFPNPMSGGTVGALNGNAAGNRSARTASITSLSIANGATFCVRWNDVDASGADDGLAIDDFSLTVPAGTTALSIADVAVMEGNSGTTSAAFTVSLSAPAPAGGVSFDVATADGTATAGSDYVSLALTGQAIAAGATSATVTVTVNGDTGVELDETFFVNVTNVVGATVLDGQALGTITNDDAAASPDLSVADVSVAEGNSGTTNARFTVTLATPAPAGGVTFDIATADGTATAGSDYIALALTGQAIAAGATSATVDVVVNGDVDFEADETFTVSVTNVVGATVVDGSATGTISNDDVGLTAIHAVQGSGSQSPIVGTDVAVVGIVTARKSNGFFVQTADTDADADPSTSQALFVFTSTAPPAAATVGNRVRVFGRVTEFAFSDTVTRALPLTQLAGAAGVTLTVTQISAGNPLPTPIDLAASDLAPGNGREAMERLEGMRVRAPSLVTVAPTNANISEANATASGGNGVFFATLAGVPRPLREPGLDPDELVSTTASGTIPRFDNNTELLRIDSDGQVGAANVRADTGATISNLVGVVDYAFNYYSLLPDAGQLTVDAGGFLVGGRSPTGVAAGATEEITVGAYNLLRFFDSVNDPLTGEPVLTAAALTKRLGHTTEAICRYVQLPDVLGVVEVENLAVLTLLANEINTRGAAGELGCTRNPEYVAYLEEGNDVGGIDVGFLVSARAVRAGVPRVSVVEVTQLGKDTLFTNPDTSTELLNDRPPLMMRAVFNHADGGSEPLTIYVNHLRSLGGVSDTATGSNGWPTSGARVRAKRGAQAQYLAQLVHDRQVAAPDERIVLLGDFNVFEFNDGLVDGMGIITGRPAAADQVLLPLTSPIATPLTVMTPLSPRDEQYSFSFDGNAQSLDHAVVNEAVFSRLRDVRTEHARINADFAEFRFGTGPLRTSDHDPVVLYLRVPGFRDVDLGVDAVAIAPSVAAGSAARYTVTVANASALASDGATLRLVLDRALAGTTVTAPAGWTCGAAVLDTASTTIECVATALAASDSAVFTAEAPTAATIGRVTIGLSATIVGLNGDRLNANNVDTASVAITSNAAPAFTGTPAIAGSAAVGATLGLTGLDASDADGDAVTLAYEWLRNGTPIAGATAATYVVVEADRGTSISARVTASDGTAQTVATTAAVAIPAAPANRAPVANDDAYSVTAGQLLDVAAPGLLGNDTDADGDTLTATLLGAPVSGTATISANGALRYEPNAGFSGDDSLTYRACDPSTACATATVRLTVVPRPTALATRDDRFVIAENAGALRLDVIGNDVIDAARRVAGRLELVQAPLAGTASIDDGGTPADASDDRIAYRPNADRSGDDLLSYRLCEGGTGTRCAEAMVQIVVRPLTDAQTRFEIAGNGGFRDASVGTYRAMSDARTAASPLVAPRIDEPTLGVDATPEDAFDASGRAVLTGELPAGAEWRVLVDARSISGGDIDVYVGLDANGDRQADRSELRCVSAMSPSAERCELTVANSATPVRYWVIAHNVGTSAHTARIERFEVPLIDADGTLVATGPANAPRLGPWPLRISWRDPTLLDGESRAGYVALRSEATAAPAWMPVRVDRRGGEATPLAVTPAQAETLRLAANERNARVFIDVPPGQTRLTVTFDSASVVGLVAQRAPATTPQAEPPLIPTSPAGTTVRTQDIGPGASVLDFDAPAAGRWTFVLTNPAATATSVQVRVALAGTAPIVRPGSYYNPARGGHGLFVYPAGTQWAGLWFTYAQDGTPAWYYLQDPAPGSNGVWRSRLYRSTWNGSRNTLTVVGSAVLTPSGDDAFTFTHTVDGETGSEAMAAFGRGCPAIGSTPVDASGLWFNPARAGSGYAIQLFPDYEFLSVFGYDDRGVARFAAAERTGFGGAETTVTLEQLQGFCPLCTRSGSPQRTAIGTFRRTFGANGLQQVTLDAAWVNGVPGRWAANETVVPLGPTQGCAAP